MIGFVTIAVDAYIAAAVALNLGDDTLALVAALVATVAVIAIAMLSLDDEDPR